MYNESEQAREAKELIKLHLHLPDGVAQGHVDALDEVHLANLVASRNYPPHDRPQVIRSILTPSAPPYVATSPATLADDATLDPAAPAVPADDATPHTE